MASFGVHAVIFRVAELVVGGEVMMALVAQRNIQKGEWFSVAHDADTDEDELE